LYDVLYREYRDGAERFTVIGVTSGTVGCGGTFPDFYTYVQHVEVF
jgi:hypothetical protein